MSHPRFGDWQPFDQTGRRKYVTGDEGRRFLTEADKLCPELRALCLVLAFTGCRVSEALALRQHQLDLECRTLSFRTLKRRRLVFRSVPIPEAVVEALLAIPVHPCGRFWIIHRSTAWRLIKRVMADAQIRGPMATCKGLRHGFGMKAAARSIPPNLIQRWLGHASVSTTILYLDAVGVEEREFAKRLW